MKYLKILLSVFLVVLLQAACSTVQVASDKKYIDASFMPFITRANTLPLNVPYDSIQQLRYDLQKELGTRLYFMTNWDPQGEAHVTVVTPVEYEEVLSKYLTMREINNIALKNNIQDTTLKVLGIGKGSMIINKKNEDTYFLIVSAPKLLKIRKEISKEIIKRGASKEQPEFRPQEFYPHITIGYTLKDLHIQDGVIKDMQNSHDDKLDFLLQ